MPRTDALPPLRLPTSEVIYAEGFDAPAALAAARHGTEHGLVEHGARPAHANDAALVLSELATNALCHGDAPFSVLVMRVDDVTVVEVFDGTRDPVETRAPRFENGGYGLHLVDQLSDSWGVHYDDQHGRKVVWALLKDEHANA